MSEATRGMDHPPDITALIRATLVHSLSDELDANPSAFAPNHTAQASSPHERSDMRERDHFPDVATLILATLAAAGRAMTARRMRDKYDASSGIRHQLSALSASSSLLTFFSGGERCDGWSVPCFYYSLQTRRMPSKARCRNRSVAPPETARRFATRRAARPRPPSPCTRDWTFTSSRRHRRTRPGCKVTASRTSSCWGIPTPAPSTEMRCRFPRHRSRRSTWTHRPRLPVAAPVASVFRAIRASLSAVRPGIDRAIVVTAIAVH